MTNGTTNGDATDRIFFPMTINRPEFHLPISTWGMSLGDEDVAINDLDSFEADDEDPFNATEFYVTYRGVEYMFEVPDRDSKDWDIYEEMFYPE